MVKTMKNYSIDSLIEISNTTEIPQITTLQRIGNKICSFGIVNSESNGKRTTISKALAEALNITDTAYILPVVAEGVIILSSFPLNKANTMPYRGKDRKTCYSADLVRTLTTLFKIDFSEHVSKSFKDIVFDTYNENPIAIIPLSVYQDDSSENSENDNV